MTAKDLKNALLQEAVQGKLVPQIASEGNARDLLEEIRKEKLSHGLDFANAKSGKRKSKKETALAGSNPCDIKEEEIPFDIPESWCWCKIKDIAYVSTGMTPLKSESKFYENGNIPWVTSTLTSSDYIDKADTYITEFALNNTTLDLYPVHTLILAMYGQGKTRGQISELLIPATINQACAAIELYSSNETLRKYMKLFHNWNYNNLRKEAAGSAQPNLNLNIIQNTLFPLPPLAEQKRIVDAIEKFMPLIEEYGKKETELKALNEQIGTLTKKAILQEAVQGKLVPQIAAEGNAKDLLEEIRKERSSHGFDFANAKSGKTKSKKETALAGSNPCDISDDEIPFDIPESWCWCRLGEISTNITAGGDKPSHFSKTITEKLTVPVISNGEKNDGVFGYTDRATITEKAITVSGRGNIGFTKVRNEPFMPIVRLITITFPNILDFKYLEIAISFLVADGNGSAVQQLTVPMIKPLLIPLPPLAEQKRIVAVIEKMLPLCEKLGE